MSEPSIHVVDDDVDVLGALETMLKALGMRVATYGSAEEFLATEALNGEGCILIDVRMPGMGGLELAKQLSERGSRLSIILISGHQDDSKLSEIDQLGIVDFLYKPFRLAELRQAVQRGLAAGT
jgi:FixJ family two-component response regulator